MTVNDDYVPTWTVTVEALSLIWQCNCIVDSKVPNQPLNQLLARSTKPEDTEQ
ncbi:hypothetical protein T4C_8804 [Trichinella pseudospiralis]|uniref:Uncharacterized protein n=1 Tax=Trichinella pseudospiralis TaxID=6337 RepID=A0A0V1GQ50_TRIPS|nr:hypothetical protein T4C_8804 [Trichinella pseudospiralis]